MTPSFDVLNPARFREVVGRVALNSEAEVDAIVARAHAVRHEWSATLPEQRAAALRAAANALEPRVVELANLFTRENGKPFREAERDIRRTIELARILADDLPVWWTPELFDAAQPVWARRRARGVTAVISPWNSPVLLSFKRIFPALAAGNPVVVKPATQCPLAVMECIRIVASHLPEGVLQAVMGSGGTVGEQLATDPRVRAIAFTGSTETGRRIMELASRTLKKVVLELGGNDPALVLEDAELDQAAVERMANAVLRAAGQVCVAVKRIYVHESRYRELVEKLSGSFDSRVVGDGLRDEVTMGPLSNKSQFDYVSDLVRRARGQNCDVITAGRKYDPDSWEGGYFMQPTIVLGAADEQDIVSCEQFGPVIPILKFTDVNDAIERANRSEFGLRASVWTADRERATAIADRLEAGAVFYNNHGIFKDLHLEFPGLKQSGFGRESQHAGMDHYADTYGFAD